MQRVRSSEAAQQLLVDDEATSRAAAKKAKKRQQQKDKKHQAKQQLESSLLQLPSVLPAAVAEEATFDMMAGTSVGSSNPCSGQHGEDQAVTAEQAALPSGTTGGRDETISTALDSHEGLALQHDDACMPGRAGDTREEADADVQFMLHLSVIFAQARMFLTPAVQPNALVQHILSNHARICIICIYIGDLPVLSSLSSQASELNTCLGVSSQIYWNCHDKKADAPLDWQRQ